MKPLQEKNEELKRTRSFPRINSIQKDLYYHYGCLLIRIHVDLPAVQIMDYQLQMRIMIMEFKHYTVSNFHN